MGDAWVRDIGIILLMVTVSLLIVLPLQLLLCFKGTRRFLRMLPSIVLAAGTLILFIMMRVAKDWNAVGYAILSVFFGVLLLASGIAWGVWAIIKLIRKNMDQVDADPTATDSTDTDSTDTDSTDTDSTDTDSTDTEQPATEE